MKIKIKRNYNGLTLEAQQIIHFSLRNERNTFLAQNEQYEKDLIDFNENLTEAKKIMQKLVANAPNTYSGTNIELQQKKMFSFQDAVNKAEQFLNNEVKK